MTSLFRFVPEQASTIAARVDEVTLALLVLSGAVLLVVFGLIAAFGILYRKDSPRSRQGGNAGNLLLEWGWTLVTFGLFIGIFVWAAVLYFDMHLPPRDSSEISVVGKQWMWKFQHPNGKREINELHIPVGKPIVLNMTSEDVIHSLFVPDFRIKQDVLPGRYTRTWFEAKRIGEYHLFCSQYCGTMHAGMRGRVVVMSQPDYQRWLQAGSSLQPMTSRGSRLFTQRGCVSCHGGENPGIRAPALGGIFGTEVGLSDGKTVFADENYLRESIIDPRAKIVMGYTPIMPSYAGQLSEEELLDLIAYVKSLKGTP
jgi:cytochrome c oxidase subunit 2